ncbi:MAG: valine--tRNA ligase [Calditrichota bacterium]
MEKSPLTISDIPKIYDPTSVEGKRYKFWEDYNLFRTDPDSGKKPYCIMMPPPNVTGELHMGHALQDSLQDMLIRLKRMQGYEAFWQPGKDHAGIATQNVVEKSLATQGINRHDLGRDKFVDRVWAWKERFGNRIFEQKRALGDSADWSRERFTLDEGLSRSVARVFVHLYQKGLIYRGYYIVNWCPRCHTAISDEEVNHREHQSHLWFFKYPLKGETPPSPPQQSRRGKDELLQSRGGNARNEFVTVATTRPETMLGDTAIAVNPQDERFKHLVGSTVILPLANREIPIIADEFVDPQFGTGQVKVTPAHDPNDFIMGQRHNLAQVIIMNELGQMNENVPEPFRGMDRFTAREAVVKALQELGLVEKIDNYSTSIGHCQRCDTIIEPYLSRQWFVKMKPLAEPAIQAVKEGRIKFYPGRWEKVYYAWMENIRDWCISRQLWWGHRIPVWYCADCGAVIVREDAPDICPQCGSTRLNQDEDVLDTWFSSWLWPFSTLGWPERTREMDFWYPTHVLVSAYDIIFFWIARMIMAGLEFTDEIPFHDIYITGMIKDELGRWMSKSLGNGIDPGQMAQEYGADAVRFTLITLASEGQDIKLSPSRFEGGRNFANKLWNSYRFLRSQVNKLGHPLPAGGSFTLTLEAPLEDRWILNRLRASTQSVLDNADKYRLNDCMTALYDFIWKEYCDWYLEALKKRLSDDQPAEARRPTLALAVGIFQEAMKLLHPGMPFITEEIWQGLESCKSGASDDRTETRVKSIMTQRYPQPSDYSLDPSADAEMDLIQKVIGQVRNIRSEMKAPPDKKADLAISGASAAKRCLLEENTIILKSLATLSNIEYCDVRPPQSASAMVEEMELYVPLKGLIDLDIERGRLEKEKARLDSLIKGAEAKLTNPKFMDKAPADVREHEARKLEECQAQLAVLLKNLEVLAK